MAAAASNEPRMRNNQAPQVRVPALHIDMGALQSMQGIETRDSNSKTCDATSSPTYPFDSVVDETSDMDTLESRKSLCLAITPRTAREYKREKTSHGKDTLSTQDKEITPSHATLVFDIPDKPPSQNNKRPSEPLRKNRKLTKLKRQDTLSKIKSTLDSDTISFSTRSKTSPLVASGSNDDFSQPESFTKNKQKKNLQWMDFKSTLNPNNSENSRGERDNTREDQFNPRLTARQNSVIHPDDWSLIEKEIQRYAAKAGGGESEKALHTLMRTISMTHTFHRLDWRMLVRSLGHDAAAIANSDFFSIYSWSTRKKVNETHPLTAYVKENTDVTSERIHGDLHIGNASADEDQFRQKRRRSRPFIPGPLGSKYVRTPRGYCMKNEKSKTPGELAIEEARVKNSVVNKMNSTDSHEKFTHPKSNPQRSSENVQLPDIHLPQTRSNTESYFRKFVPGKTIRSTKETKDPSLIAFDSSLQVRNINPTTLNPLYSNGVLRLSTGGSYGSGGSDGTLPSIDHRASLVGTESQYSLGRTLNASTFMPVPRPHDRHKGQLAALSYKKRLREGTPPKPPPATPEAYHVGMATLDDAMNEFDVMGGMHRHGSAHSGESGGSAHKRDPYCYACMSEESSSVTESSLSSAGSQVSLVSAVQEYGVGTSGE